MGNWSIGSSSLGSTVIVKVGRGKKLDWGKDLDEIGEDPDEIMRRKGDMSEIKRWDWGKRMGNWVINEAMVRYFF